MFPTGVATSFLQEPQPPNQTTCFLLTKEGLGESIWVLEICAVAFSFSCLCFFWFFCSGVLTTVFFFFLWAACQLINISFYSKKMPFISSYSISLSLFLNAGFPAHLSLFAVLLKAVPSFSRLYMNTWMNPASCQTWMGSKISLHL